MTNGYAKGQSNYIYCKTSAFLTIVVVVLLTRSILSLLLLLQAILDETLLVGVEEEVGEPSCASRWCPWSPLRIALHGLLGAFQHLKHLSFRSYLKKR